MCIFHFQMEYSIDLEIWNLRFCKIFSTFEKNKFRIISRDQIHEYIIYCNFFEEKIN